MGLEVFRVWGLKSLGFGVWCLGVWLLGLGVEEFLQTPRRRKASPQDLANSQNLGLIRNPTAFMTAKEMLRS